MEKRRRELDPILFDLDGTLTESGDGILRCVQYALAFYGIEAETEALRPFIGPPLEESFRRFYGFDEKKAAEAVAKYRERFSAVGLYENRVYDGIPNLLSALKKAGKTLCVATSKPQIYTEKILSHFALDGYFAPEFVVGAEMDVKGRNEKADIIAETLRRLRTAGIDTAGAVMVGDRRQDVYGGAQNRLPVIGVRYGYAEEGELEDAGAFAVVSTVDELQALLLSKTDSEELL